MVFDSGGYSLLDNFFVLKLKKTAIDRMIIRQNQWKFKRRENRRVFSYDILNYLYIKIIIK